MANRVVIDKEAIAHFLKIEIRPRIEELGDQVASFVDVGSVIDADVIVRSYTTDRAAVAVSIAHPAGLAIQAKHGALTRAASAAGLEVRPFKSGKS